MDRTIENEFLLIFVVYIIFLQRYGTAKKEKAHQDKPAPALEKASLKSIIELDCTSIEDIQDRAYMCLVMFTGMRNNDVHGIKSKKYCFPTIC